MKTLVSLILQDSRQRYWPAIERAAIGLIACSMFCTAAPADLDVTFGDDGRIFTSIGAGSIADRAKCMTGQTDGKILVAGSSQIGTDYPISVARYNPDGSLDSSFSGDGKATIVFAGSDAEAGAIAVRSDGKIIIVGTLNAGNSTASEIVIVRLNPDGGLDTSFDLDGQLSYHVGDSEHGRCVAVQGDGKILVGGYATVIGGVDYFLLRFNPDGTPDTTFSGDGKTTTPVASGSGDDQAHCIALQSDGKILLAGNSTGPTVNQMFSVVRYNSNGSLDTSFDSDGKVIVGVNPYTHYGFCMALQGDGKIIIGGYNQKGNSWAMVRLNSNGSLDLNFGTGGNVLFEKGYYSNAGFALAIQSNGQIVTAGVSTDYLFVVARFNSNGQLDIGFNQAGYVQTVCGTGTPNVAGLEIASNGNLLVAGHSGATGGYDYALLRYEGGGDSDHDGLSDVVETNTGIYVSPSDTGTNPLDPDSDRDGLSDGEEIACGSNPQVRDTDGDGFDDGFEVSVGFSPTAAASMPSTYSRIYPAVEFEFNGARDSTYRIEASVDLENWITIETGIPGNGSVVNRFYPTRGNDKRYFRVIEE